MDYQTKPTSRRDLRSYSKLVRKLFDVPLTGPFPVLEVLDRLSYVFKGSNYEIVEDHRMSPQTMARCNLVPRIWNNSTGLNNNPIKRREMPK